MTGQMAQKAFGVLSRISSLFADGLFMTGMMKELSVTTTMPGGTP